MRSKQIISLVLGLIFIGISVYLALNLVEVSKNLIAKVGLGWVVATILTRVLVCLSFARGLQLIFQALKPSFNTFIVFIIGFVLGFGLSFFSPIYESDYGDAATQDLVIDHDGLTALTNGQYQIKNEPYIVAFFTTSCPHCKLASENLGFMSQVGNFPPVVAIFPGNEEDTRKFLEENNGHTFEHYRISDEKYFLDNSGAGFPSVFLINEKGETVKHWFGDLLNYTALDYLESIK